MTFRTSAALVLAFVFSAATQAGELSFFQKMELTNACGQDIKAACPDARRGDGQLLQCIRDHAEQLSQPCRDTISRIKADLFAGTDAAMDF